jgi:hypothetical protein
MSERDGTGTLTITRKAVEGSPLLSVDITGEWRLKEVAVALVEVVKEITAGRKEAYVDLYFEVSAVLAVALNAASKAERAAQAPSGGEASPEQLSVFHGRPIGTSSTPITDGLGYTEDMEEHDRLKMESFMCSMVIAKLQQDPDGTQEVSHRLLGELWAFRLERLMDLWLAAMRKAGVDVTFAEPQ